MIDIPIGSIITELAVLEIHIERNAVATIKPNMTFLTLVPISCTIFKAILLCRIQRSIAMANIKPPIYKKIYLWPNEAVVSANSIPPVKGNKTIGNKDVIAIGTASVIHQMAIQIVEAKIAFASLLNPSG